MYVYARVCGVHTRSIEQSVAGHSKKIVVFLFFVYSMKKTSMKTVDFWILFVMHCIFFFCYFFFVFVAIDDRSM